MYKLACLAVAAAALAAIPGTANAQSSVTCESSRGRRETCRVDTRGEVRLVQQLSDTRCIRGRNWGTIPGAVWVDNGCRGRFAAYGNRGGSYDDRYGRSGRGYDDRHGRGYDDRDGRNGRWDDRDRGRGVGGSWAVERCRQAVRREIGNRRLNLWLENNHGNNARVGWRADRGQSGSCRVERNGHVDVHYDRRR